MEQYVFVFWITSMPIVSLPYIYEGAKVWWFWLGGIVLSLFWIRRLIQNHPFHPDVSRWLFLTWIGVLCVASIIGVHPWESMVGGSYRHQGVLFFGLLFLVSLTLPLLSKKVTALCVSILSMVSLVQATYIYVQATAYHTSAWGTFGEVHAAAGYLAISSIFSLYALRRHTILSFIACAFMIGAIGLTGSRAGILAMGILIIFVCLRYMKKIGTVGKIFMLSAGLVLAAVALLYVSWKTDLHPVANSYEDRSTYWRLAQRGIQGRPFFGYGAESGEVVFEKLFLREDVRLVDFMVDRAHNVFLDVSLWSGVTGSIIFVLWMGTATLSLVRKKAWYQVLGVCVWLAYAWVQPLGVVHWLFLLLFFYLDGMVTSNVSD